MTIDQRAAICNVNFQNTFIYIILPFVNSRGVVNAEMPSYKAQYGIQQLKFHSYV